MKIVVLDGYTLNPGDLSWRELEELGSLTVYDRTPPGLAAERCRDADIVLTNKVPVRARELEHAANLKYIGVLATGYNIIDTVTARDRGIVVSNVPGYSTSSVAQLAFALLLELCLNVKQHSDSVIAGAWSASADFSFRETPLIELRGKTMAIIGFGTIGQGVADIASAFGMKVIAHSRTQTDQSQREDFRWVSLDELFRTADVISLHCPLTPETEGLIRQENLALMKPSALLLNTARGPIVVDQDLANALNTGMIAGAGLDVLSTEPPTNGSPLIGARNCLITPHIAWATFEARTRLMKETVANILAFLNGRPVNVVNA